MNHLEIATLRAGVKLDGGELPQRMRIIPWGLTKTRKGNFLVDELTASALQRNQEAMRRPRIDGDFEHESVAPKAHPIKYAIKGARLSVVPGEGVFVEDFVWTEAGREHVPVDYNEISAAPYRDPKTDRVLGFHSFALCAHAEVPGLDVVKLSAELDEAGLITLSPAELVPGTNKTKNENKRMIDPKLKTLLGAMGVTVADDADDAAVEAAVQDALARMKKEPAELSAGAQAVLATLTAKLEKLEQGEVKREISAARDKAVGEGKLVTLSVDQMAKLGLEDAKVYLDGLTAGEVPMQQQTPAGRDAGKGAGPDPETLSVWKGMGYSEEDIKTLSASHS